MAIVSLGSNISSIGAQRKLNDVTGRVNTTLERLSSGLRINHASDDAAGLAIASQLKASARVFSQGVRNLNDGLSLLNIADSALQELGTITSRLQELAAQSASGTYSHTQRRAIDTEAQALSAEFTRLVQSTEYNGQNILSGDFGNLRLQAGFGVDGSIQSNLGGAVGTGNFRIVQTDSNPVFNGNVIVGDINSDGHQDIVDLEKIQFGNGDGTFRAPVSLLADGFTVGGNGMILSDFNNDGTLDIYVGSRALLGNGDGTFTRAPLLNLGIGDAYGLAAADFNGDGNMDVAYASGGGSVVALGLGNGQFTGAVLPGSTSTYEVMSGDLNGDGRTDLIFPTLAAPEMSVYLGSSNGTFSSSMTINIAVTWAKGTGLADINGDNKLDLVYSDDGITGVQLGLGDGTFGASTTYAFGGNDLTLRDVNGDAIKDYVYFVDGNLVTALGSGTGTFASPVTSANILPTIESNSIAMADFNEDGVADVAAGWNSPTGTTATVWLADTTSGVSPLLPFDLSTKAGALQAIPILSDANDRLSAQRGSVGAFQSRIGSALGTLRSNIDAYSIARSRIEDADIAAEAAELVRATILQKAATAVLGQANQQSSLVLKLLQL